MIKIGDVVLRNIQEQVEKNKNDIAAWTTLDAFGIRVLGIVATDADIPEGTYEYGDAYLVGPQPPYDLYIYTRGANAFVEIGPLTIVGPQGPQGDPGQAGTITVGSVITGNAGSLAAVQNVGTSQNAILNFIIPRGNTGAQGAQGERGLTGEAGPAGQTGPQGPQGDPGQSFMIVGVITNTSQLPDPTTTQRNYAYVYNDGDPTTPDRLYYIIGDPGEETWTYSSLAAAGTTVYVNGNPVSSFDADDKLNEPATTGSQGDVLTLGANGPEWNTPSIPSAGSKITTLWTNPDPTSSFASQTVLLSSSDYDYLLVLFNNWTGAPNDPALSLQQIFIPKGQSGYLESTGANSSSRTINTYKRTITRISDTQYTIGDMTQIAVSSWSSFTTTTNNGAMIPIYILGIKE